MLLFRLFFLLMSMLLVVGSSCSEDASSSDEGDDALSDGDLYSDGDRPDSDGDSDFEGYEPEEEPEPIILRGRVFVPDDFAAIPVVVRLEQDGEVVQRLELEARGERSFIPFVFSSLEDGTYELHGTLLLFDATDGALEDIERAYSQNPIVMSLQEQEEYGPVDLRIGFASVADGDAEGEFSEDEPGDDDDDDDDTADGDEEDWETEVEFPSEDEGDGDDSRLPPDGDEESGVQDDESP